MFAAQINRTSRKCAAYVAASNKSVFRLFLKVVGYIRMLATDGVASHFRRWIYELQSQRLVFSLCLKGCHVSQFVVGFPAAAETRCSSSHSQTLSRDIS